MNATKIPLSECCEGDVLAADIYNSHGVKLVSSNTVLNFYIKDRLSEIGVEDMDVYSPPSRERQDRFQYRVVESCYKQSVLTLKSMLNDIARGEKPNYQKIVELTDITYQNVESNRAIVRYLSSIRDNDEYTYTHCVNTSFYCMLIAKWMGLGEADIKKAIQAGYLHDIGKAKIPWRILKKPGPLNRYEIKVIQKHPVYGYDILKTDEQIDFNIKMAVLFHHERADGSGYPFRISDDSVGLLAKIVAIADVYDAMTTDRSYKPRATPFCAFQMFLTQGLKMFDTHISDIFISRLSAYYTGGEVRLSTGETGRIVYIPPQNILLPIVKTGSRYVETGKNITIEAMI